MKADKVVEAIKRFVESTANKTCAAVITDVVHARGFMWCVTGYLEFMKATNAPEPKDNEIPWFRAIAFTEGEEIEIEDFESMINSSEAEMFIYRAKGIASGRSDKAED